jgi:hypothetical protein
MALDRWLHYGVGVGLFALLTLCTTAALWYRPPDTGPQLYLDEQAACWSGPTVRLPLVAAGITGAAAFDVTVRLPLGATFVDAAPARGLIDAMGWPTDATCVPVQSQRGLLHLSCERDGGVGVPLEGPLYELAFHDSANPLTFEVVDAHMHDADGRAHALDGRSATAETP